MAKANGVEREKWQEQIAAFTRSGLTRSKYCRENSIATHQLAYWQKKLRGKSATADKFIPLDLRARGRSGVGIRVVLSSAIVIELSELPDPAWVHSLIRKGGRHGGDE